MPRTEVLTLAEAAAYLRLGEEETRQAAERQELPGRLIAGQWRFHRQALADWLRREEPFSRSLERLLANRGAVDNEDVSPGSSEAVSRVVGFLRDSEEDPEALLSEIRRLRQEWSH